MFGQLTGDLLAAPQPDPETFAEAVRSVIEPLNVAGLADPKKRNRYPVELRDLVENAGKLGMTAAAMEQWTEVERLRCRPERS